MNEDLLTINVNVAEYSYPILIERQEEEEIRKAAKFLNEIILEFKKKYPAGSDSKIYPIDYVNMAAVQIALKCVCLEAEKDVDLLTGEIDNISQKLGNYLKSGENTTIQ